MKILELKIKDKRKYVILKITEINQLKMIKITGSNNRINNYLTSR